MRSTTDASGFLVSLSVFSNYTSTLLREVAATTLAQWTQTIVHVLYARLLLSPGDLELECTHP